MNSELKFRDFDYDTKQIRFFDIDGYDRQEHNCYGNIMRFTGLKDKNGIDIYEDDIVQSPLTGIGVIVWLDFHGWSFKSGDNPMWMREETWKTFKVIGNVHENEELLNNK